MSGTAAPPSSRGVTVRTATLDDAAAIASVQDQAFAPDGRPRQLVEAIVASTRFVPELSIVATEGEDVVGHVLFSHVDLESSDTVSTEVLALTPLAVRPSHQGRGVGQALVREGLLRARARGELLATVEGHPGYYPRFGFVVAATIGIEMRLPNWAPPEAAMALALEGSAELRGRLVYPPTFDVVLED